MTPATGSEGRRVLVTGASGFLGRHCIEPLRARGYDVHAVTSRELPRNSSGVVWHHVNLHDPSATQRLCTTLGASHLLHLAWAFGPGGADGAQEGECPGHFQWTQSTLHLVRKFTEAGGRRAVGAGSSQEYDWNSGVCSELTTPRKPANYYGVCKNSLFEVLSGYAEQVTLSLAWARIFFLYGPHEPSSRLIPMVIRSVLSGEPALCSHGRQVRDYLFVEDAAEAVVAILDSDFVGPINVGSGTPIALRDLVSRVVERLGRPELLRLGVLPARSTDVPLVVADTRRLQNEIGWQPQVSLDEGLDRTIDFWRSQVTQSI